MGDEVDDIPVLKPKVIEHLDTNFGGDWCMGNEKYRENESHSLSLFFQKPEQAELFASTHSIFGGVVEKVDRFDDIKYILKDKKLVEVENGDEEFIPPTDTYTKEE